MREDEALAAGLSGELTPFGHRLLARVYYADTDFSGLVYHARYLEFLERGRSDYLRLAGVRHTELAEGLRGEKIVWIVRRMEIDFPEARPHGRRADDRHAHRQDFRRAHLHGAANPPW